MLKTIIKQNKFFTILSVILCITSCAVMVYAGYSLTFLFNTYNQANNDINAFIFLALKVSLIWIIALIILYVYKFTLSYTLCKMRNILRNIIGEKIISQSYEEYINKDTGNQVSWLTNDVEHINSLAFNNVFAIIESISTACFSFIAMIKLSIYIGLASIILFFFISLLPQILSKKLVKYSKMVSQKQEVVLEKFKEQIEGFVLFLSTNKLGRIKNEINEASVDLENTKYKFYKKQAGISTIITGINVLGQVILIVITIFLSIKGLAQIGAVLSIANLSGSFFSGVGAIVNEIVGFKSAKPILNKFKIDNKKENEEENCNIQNFDEVQLKNVSYGYDKKVVIDNTCMTFKKGEKYAILGQSGCGKSTVAKLIMGFLNNYDGIITVNGTNLSNISKTNWYEKIAYIDQNVFLFNGSIRENLTLGNNYDESEIWDTLLTCQLDDYVKSLENGLDSIITEKGKNMSGGQKQRIALARALLQKPEVIIMDEGTSALDIKNSIEIENNILLNKNLCAIIITHHLRDEIKPKLSHIYEMPPQHLSITDNLSV